MKRAIITTVALRWIVLCLVVASCGRVKTGSNSSELMAKVFKNATTGYGYDIYQHDRKIIHQPHVPAIVCTKGFPTRAKAEQTALLVMQKIQSGEMPPSLTVSELEKLKVIEPDVESKW